RKGDRRLGQRDRLRKGSDQVTPHAIMHAPIVLQLRGICKRYPGIQALNDAALEVRAGEVHVLLGENGAGKSTLMKILSGAVRRDSGDVVLNGSPADLADPNRARKLGISTIYQELSL